MWNSYVDVGLYVSEREDELGTYYRGPGGALYVGSESAPGLSKTYDGGIWVPKNQDQLPRIYVYVRVGPAPVAPPTTDLNCMNAAIVKDASTNNVSVVSVASAGAAGALAGRASVPGSSLSYGAAGAGGAIGAGIVALLINAEQGNLYVYSAEETGGLAPKLKALVAQPTVLKAVQSPTALTDQPKQHH